MTVQSLRAILDRYSEPDASVVDPERRRRARLLASLLIAFVPLGLLIAAVPALVDRARASLQDTHFPLVAAAALIWLVAYRLSRTRRYPLAGVLALGAGWVVVFVVAITGGDYRDIDFLILLVLVSSFLLPLRATALLSALSLVGTLVLPLLTPGVSLADVADNPFSFLLMGSVIILLTTYYRDQLEKERRADLEVSEARYRTLAEAANDMIFIIGRDGRVQYLNSYAADKFGQPPEALIGQPRAALFPGPIGERQAQGLQTVLETGEPRYSEDPTPFPEHEVWLGTSLVPLKDDSGRITAVLGIARDITQRRRAQEALQQTNATLRAIVQASPLAIHVFDPDGNLHMWNPASESLFGWREDETLGRALPYLSPDDQAEFKRLLGRVLGGESFANLEVKRRRRDGAAVDLSLSIAPLRDADERIVGIMSVSADITERKRAETALRESERRFHELLENVKLLAVMLDAGGKVTFCNDCLLDLTGWRREEAVGRDWFESFLPEGTRDEVRPIFLETLLSGSFPSHYENDIVTRLGQRRLIAWNNTVLRDPQGNVAGTASIGEDITERRRVEAQLRQLSRAVEQSPASVVITDTSGIIEYVNPKFCEITGYTAGEVVGQNPRVLKSGHTSPEEYKRLWDTIIAGGEWRGEFHNRRKNGELFWESASISPITDEAGVITHFLAVKEDITERKRAEEAQRQQRELAEANERLRQLDRVKDQFVSNVSHELRTPIANVKLYLDLLQRGKPEKHEQYMHTLHSEAARLEKLIENLLDISRLDMDVVTVHLQPTDLNQLLERLIADQSELAADRGLSVEYRPGRDLPRGLADAPRLDQVLSNLMTNALHFTPPGGSITLSTAVRALDGQARVTITITDSGPGISAEELPRLFGRFFRGAAGRASGVPGAGLGLAICKEIMDRLEGRITVDSQPGQGAAFTVWLKPAMEN